MAVYRGGIYVASDPDEADHWLVLSNDEWNDIMLDVVAVPLGKPSDFSVVPPHSCRGELHGTEQIAVVGAMQSISKLDDLGALNASASAEHLACVEDELMDLLELKLLCGPSPKAPGVVGSPDRYLRWGEMYYGPPRGHPPERKRYVVVSNNDWNATMPQVLCVRTTSSPRRGGLGFPELTGGYKACCGNISAVRAGALNLRNRPPGTVSMSIKDMVTIARGIADSLDLPVSI